MGNSIKQAGESIGFFVQLPCHKTGQPRTAHTTNPVPFLWITQKERGNDTQLPLQQLRDIAPFILKNMGIEIPKKMEK